MEPTRAELEAFQLALHRALFEESDPAAVRARLLADPAGTPFVGYIEALEPRLVEVVGLLARRWTSTSSRWEDPER